MGRRVKCKICGQVSNSDIAYRVTTKGKNTYYCNEEEYNELLKKRESAFRCEGVILNILNIPFISPMLKKELSEVSKFYTYEVIERTFKENEQQISWFLNNNANSTEFGKIRYVMAIVKNNINAIDKKYKAEQKRIKELFDKQDNIDIDIINDIDTTPKTVAKDISEFLFD